MNGDRWRVIVQAFAGAGTDGDGSDRDGGVQLCRVSQDLLGVSALAITMGTDRYRSRLCAADGLADEMDDLQFTIGQGPSIEASTTGQAVAVYSLDDAGDRWPAFAGPALLAGVCSVFAVPLRLGAASLGVLTLYETVPGRLHPTKLADAQLVADAVTHRIITMQTHAVPGELSDGLAGVELHLSQVHQASGMVSVQLEIGIVEALLRLRTHAYATSRPVAEVANDVIANRLRLQ
ncbi:MAG TPA: GAF and ANTAR domain-containing protein [Acidimicrobiales bacterium]|jgi:hypothetical protein|nr:GAF and ANTAR domain-containing protein [Acidimicrobiales bacterium]